jgi:glyoxylate/hydroxypyruvate/2-ketogluconate reductase
MVMTDMPSQHSVLVTRAVFPEVLDMLSSRFHVTSNQQDVLWTEAELIQQLQGKQGVLMSGTERVDEPLLQACPDLKICANMTVGFNNFDVPAMASRGVVATNAPDVLTETTADFGLALLLATARRLPESERYVRDGHWSRWRYDLFTGRDVHHSTLGIVGMGRIGQAIAKRAHHGFGMRVVYCNRSKLPEAIEQQYGATRMSLHDLLREADHVLLIVPYGPESHHLIGEEELALMKPGASLINLARGGVVDDAALARALHRGNIAAGLDVFENEPRIHPELLTAPNVVLTPHIASATTTTRRAMAELAARNLLSYLCDGVALTPLSA